MKLLLSTLALALSLSILPSCKEDITNAELNKHKTEITYKYVKPDQKNNVIMPLEIGNEWVYKITNFDDQGAVTSTEYQTLKINGHVQIENENWYHSGDSSVYWVNTDIGLMTKNFNNPIEFRAKYPANVGDEFLHTIIDTSWSEPRNPTQGYWYMTVTKDIEILTPAGQFKCFAYKDKIILNSDTLNWADIGKDSYSINYYAENIGFVKSVDYITDLFGYSNEKNISKIVELISYKLN